MKEKVNKGYKVKFVVLYRWCQQREVGDEKHMLFEVRTIYVTVAKEQISYDVFYITNGSIETVNKEGLNQIFGLGMCTNAEYNTDGDIVSKEDSLIHTVHLPDMKGYMELDRYRNNIIYDGKTYKFGITYNGNRYLVKKRKNYEDTSVYSECVASDFLQLMGVKAHTVQLYPYHQEQVVLVKDFVDGGGKLYSFTSLKQKYEDAIESKRVYTYKAIEQVIMNHKQWNINARNHIMYQFWIMILWDMVLANPDRHGGNWGFLKKDNQLVFAPIYDNGYGLYPNISKSLKGYTEDTRKRFLISQVKNCEAGYVKRVDEEEGHYVLKKEEFRYTVKSLDKYIGLSAAYHKLYIAGIDRVRDMAILSVTDKDIPVKLKQFYVDIICMRYLIYIWGFTDVNSYSWVVSHVQWGLFGDVE